MGADPQRTYYGLTPLNGRHTILTCNYGLDGSIDRGLLQAAQPTQPLTQSNVLIIPCALHLVINLQMTMAKASRLRRSYLVLREVVYAVKASLAPKAIDPNYKRECCGL